MNRLTTPTAPHPAARPDTVVAFAPRPNPATRETGTGYGRSSGYATSRRYASDWLAPRFRLA